MSALVARGVQVGPEHEVCSLVCDIAEGGVKAVYQLLHRQLAATCTASSRGQEEATV